MFVKKDVFGADGLSMDGKEMIFWNAKLGKKNVAQGIKEFQAFPYPLDIIRWVVIWEPRAREPEIVNVGEIEKEVEDGS